MERRVGWCVWETFRVISIDELERAAAPGWRGVEEEPLGGWLLRAAEGFTGRANSALAAGDPGMPVAEAAKRVTAWYRVQGPAGHDRRALSGRGAAPQRARHGTGRARLDAARTAAPP